MAEKPPKHQRLSLKHDSVNNQNFQHTPHKQRVTMRSLVTAAEMSGTASISWKRRGCDVNVMGDDVAAASEGAVVKVWGGGTTSDASSCSTTVPVGGRSPAGAPSSDPFDQATLGARSTSAGAGATLFMPVTNQVPR